MSAKSENDNSGRAKKTGAAKASAASRKTAADTKPAAARKPKALGSPAAIAARAEPSPAAQNEPIFTQEAMKLLKQLGNRTERGDWYDKKRGQIEAFLIEPARRMIAEVGEELLQAVPDLVVDPRIDRGIYRLYRDTRFSYDKSPYKGHLGMVWWKERPEGKLESPSFYLHLTPDNFLWSVGVYRFPETVRRVYVRFLADKKNGQSFMRIVSDLDLNGGMAFGDPEYKRPPKELAGLPWADWGRHKGLCAWRWETSREELQPGFPAKMAEKFKTGLKLFELLSELYQDAGNEGAEEGRRPKRELAAPRKPTDYDF